MENENTMIQNFWDAGKVVLRGKYIKYRPPQEARKILNKLPNFTKKLGKRTNEA